MLAHHCRGVTTYESPANGWWPSRWRQTVAQAMTPPFGCGLVKRPADLLDTVYAASLTMACSMNSLAAAAEESCPNWTFSPSVTSNVRIEA